MERSSGASPTTLQSGGTTNIRGAQVTGKGVDVDAAELNIESVQDTATYDSKQQNISAQVTVGYGASVSGSYSQSKINADYASVTEQSGILAGDDGYRIHVKGNTDLKGAIITSTQAAEDAGKNQLTTGTLSFSDIQNHSRYQGSSFGLSGGVTVGGGEAPKEISGKKLSAIGQNQTIIEKRDGQPDKKTTHGLANGFANIGIGSDSGHDSSITKSGINTANIVIRDEAAQLKRSRQTAAETIAGIHTDTTTDIYTQNAGYLKNNFDKNEVLKELNIQVEVTKDFRKNAFAAINDYVLPRQAELRAEIKNTTDEDEKTRLYDEIYKLQYLKRLLETTVGIVSGSPNPAITQGTLQLAATRMRRETLDNSRKFKGITDGTTTLSNISYDSSYFDGVKLGGVRVDLDLICGQEGERCKENPDGSWLYHGDSKLSTLKKALDKDLNPDIADMYGATGGVQGLPGEMLGSYVIGSWKDKVVESFAGAHDIMGGQMWGFYDERGNTTRGRGVEGHENRYDGTKSKITAIAAIPVAAPFALSDLLSPEVIQILLKIGGH